jgi:hypothetical protein
VTFTIEHEGKIYTVNPSNHPAEHAWFPLGDGKHSVCPKHMRVFDTRNTSRGVRFGHGVDSGFITESCGCASCYWEAHRNPTQAEVGLEETPAWWVRAIYGDPSFECWFCKDHNRHFNLDECCRRCIDEDDERETA